MKIKNNIVTFSPTDLGNFLACDHLINLEVLAKEGKLTEVYSQDPRLKLMRERGMEFEKQYVDFLKNEKKLIVCDLTNQPFEATTEAMLKGFDVIVQARLEAGNWRGNSDILLRVEQPSKLGSWSYQVQDTKLSQNTRNSAVLQLCFYNEMISKILGHTPEYMKIIKPGDPYKEEVFRYDEFKAYYKLVKRNLETAVANPKKTYPDPVEHCSICNWWKYCGDIRRGDDHLSLVAGIRSSQIIELNEQAIPTMSEFAEAIVKRPKRGHLESLVKKQDQAKIQIDGRIKNSLLHKIQPIPEPKVEGERFNKRQEHGFNLLPEPSEGDIYFDFEGDAYYEGGGLEYLFGYVYKDERGKWIYEKILSRNRKEEKIAFQEFMDFAMKRLAKHPGMCIYHFAHKEPTSFKRLMRVHGCNEEDVNKLLRGLRFVDLYTVYKRALIASVERYSLKDLEKLAKFTREVDLEQASLVRRQLELALNAGDLESITDAQLEIITGYNQDDCMATLALHQWIESKRKEYELNGAILSRLEINDGELEEKPRKEREDIKAVYENLTNELPEDRTVWSQDHHAKWLLANLLYYFQREFDSALWEYHLSVDKDEEDLADDRKAIVGLTLIDSFPPEGRRTTYVERYTYIEQEVDLKAGNSLVDVASKKHIGTVEAINLDEQSIHIKRKNDTLEIKLNSVVLYPSNTTNALFQSVMQFAVAVVDKGLGDQMPFTAGADLLKKSKPRFIKSIKESLSNYLGELLPSTIALVKILDNSVLALQGPPGTGKTHTGAEMIVALAKEKKRIGVTAVSHKAYQNLMLKVRERAAIQDVEIKLAYKGKAGSDPLDGFELLSGKKNEFKNAIDSGYVVGGTAWLWASNEAVENQLDYLFVDEAGQMSLAYVIATSRSAKNIILLGDPNQLEQPQKGTHPEGSDVAALEHILDGHKTMPEDRGIFMHTTYRLHPDICTFTSEQFYESKLRSLAGLESQITSGKTAFVGSGLFYVPINHEGCQTMSENEITAIAAIVDNLKKGEYNNLPITEKQILIVAPYNSQVNALKLRLPDLKIGTVDKFQGQEAPIVIYSMTASTSEDAPRGMKFLYDPYRFNVASSRALSICILVASPKLMQPECRTIEQMKWANVLCRYKELATTIIDFDVEP